MGIFLCTWPSLFLEEDPAEREKKMEEDGQTKKANKEDIPKYSKYLKY